MIVAAANQNSGIRRLVILGEPGSGKTWMSGYLAAELGPVTAVTEAGMGWPGPPALTYNRSIREGYGTDDPAVMTDIVLRASQRALRLSAPLILDCPTFRGHLTFRGGSPTSYTKALREVWASHPCTVILTAYDLEQLEEIGLDTGRCAHAVVSRLRPAYPDQRWDECPSPGSGVWGPVTLTTPDGSTLDGLMSTLLDALRSLYDGSTLDGLMPYLSRGGDRETGSTRTTPHHQAPYLIAARTRTEETL